MSLEDTLQDLHTVLNADIFTSDENGLGIRSLSDVYRKVEDMRDDVKLALKPMDVERFNTSYENMLADYAGMVIDQIPADGAVPPEAIVAQNRFMKYRSRREREIAL